MLFNQCHNLYDSTLITDEKIDELGNSSYNFHAVIVYLSEKKIKEFMKCYRESFPNATVLPKMHILEEHIVPWLRKWRVGFGLMGEQGAESIHAYFNSLGRTYRGIPDRVDRLKHTMKEHLLHVAPANIAATLEVKRRKRS